MRRALALPLFVLAVALAQLGCGPSGKPPVGAPMATPQATEGTVKYPDGSVLESGIILFKPVESKDGSKLRYDCFGYLESNGHFTIGFNGDGKGAASGEYKVYFDLDPRKKQTNANQIPEVYRDDTSTPLRATVKDGSNNFEFILK